MLNDETTFDIFKKNMKKKINENKPISQILMDQKHVSGVGNYIKSESLYISKISPHRKLKDINEDELKSLFNAIKKVIVSSYKSQGMSLRDYKDFEDKPGEYQFKLVVYGRKFDNLGDIKNKFSFSGNIYQIQIKVGDILSNKFKPGQISIVETPVIGAPSPGPS